MNASVEALKSTFAEELKKSLFDFINKNVPTADVNVIDDIVLSYVVTIFEEVSEDSSFDIDGFIEMMGAYVPDFTSIDEGAVCTWVLEVEAELLRQQREQKIKRDGAAGDTFDVLMPSLIDMLPPAEVKTTRNHSPSESEEEENMDHLVYESDEFTPQVKTLRELFPNSPVIEIKHCIAIADGDVELAVATQIFRDEFGESQTGAALPIPRQKLADDFTLKYRIIERYSYVDDNSEIKEHRPLAPKVEPKKLVRYRDNKIVSLKGEKYTEVPKSGAEEENLKKPKKHCP